MLSRVYLAGFKMLKNPPQLGHEGLEPLTSRLPDEFSNRSATEALREKVVVDLNFIVLVPNTIPDELYKFDNPNLKEAVLTTILCKNYGTVIK